MTGVGFDLQVSYLNWAAAKELDIEPGSEWVHPTPLVYNNHHHDDGKEGDDRTAPVWA